MDFAVHRIEAKGTAVRILSGYMFVRVKDYRDEYHYKNLGAVVS